ncbi:MAG: ComEC/Rec2 family competence protein [Alphaproteobacteria bacterium]|nr:ComEC/Rec2 family competence protein [Alphaproteobacteria bacterium]
MKKLWHRIAAATVENFKAEQSRWFMTVPFLFALGISLYFCFPTSPSPWWTVGIIEVWLLLFYLCRYKNLHWLFIGGLIIIAGFANIQARTIYQFSHTDIIKNKQTLYIKGQIENITRNENNKLRLLLNHTSGYDESFKGKFRLTTNMQNDFKIGDCVELVATVFSPRPLPVLNGFKLDRKYFYEGLSASGYANSEIFKIKCPAKTKPFINNLNSFRHKFADFINTALPRNIADVVQAVLIGEKSGISEQINDNYRNSGLAHFLSVSGLHLGTIAGLIFFLIRFILALIPPIVLRFDIKKIAAVFAVIFSAIYLLISGMATPAERAFIMTTVVFIGIIFDRQAISMRMVSFAALVLLIVAPQALISVSFQMSFAAVYALTAFYEVYSAKIAFWLHSSNFILKIFYYLSGIVICDFVASIATMPFSLYHFQRVAVYTSLGNLLAGPLIGLWLMPTILLCLAAIPFGAVLYPLKLLGTGIALLNNITAWVSNLPHSVWHCDTLSFWGFMLIICGGYWLCIWQRSWRKWGILPIVVGFLSIFIPNKQPEIIIAPQAESIAIKQNDKYVMLQFKRNNFLIKIWQEHFNLQKHYIKTTNDIKDLNLSQIKCDEALCTYKNKLRFDLTGDVRYNGKKLSPDTGYYIYDDMLKPFW